jgi:hypothetical protein
MMPVSRPKRRNPSAYIQFLPPKDAPAFDLYLQAEDSASRIAAHYRNRGHFYGGMTFVDSALDNRNPQGAPYAPIL